MANFSVSARTVDMLGRQQIAGIPTAISELFKNAHDAYADTVEVDYFRDDGLFVLRDDGVGMTLEDFEARWLTLGTDSKLFGGTMAQPPRDKGKKRRPILGEKGIGRLAIALIGSQVLVLTRARVDGKPSDSLVAAFIHWGMFEIPGIDLSDVPIPVREFKGGALPQEPEIKNMASEASQALKKVLGTEATKEQKNLLEEMSQFAVDPSECAKFLGSPNLTGDGCGTHFFIQPANSIIEQDLDEREDGVTRFERSLIGFTNTMTPDHKTPVILTKIRDHRDEGDPVEIVGDKAFFSPEEYQSVDHHFKGRFDEYGQFTGEVAIYQTNPEKYVLNWSESDGTPTRCGPFEFSFAFLQGSARDSLVPPEEFTRIRRKLNNFGGIYVYRDGIRVQPYGDSDYDFLNIEKRRTFSAGYYRYSYRRLMGAIELTSQENAALMEKAGREGFSENLAYRQFRSILMNFFIQSAGDFFREEGQFAEEYVETQTELERLFNIRKNAEKKRKARKQKFVSELGRFFEEHDPEKIRNDLKALLSNVEHKIDSVINKATPPEQKALALQRLEKDSRAKIEKIRRSLSITKPRGLVTNPEIRGEWASYLSEIEDTERTILSPLESELESLFTEKVDKSKIPLKAVTRIADKIRVDGRAASKIIRGIRSEADQSIAEISTQLRVIAKEGSSEINEATNDILEQLGNQGKKQIEAKSFSKIREDLEARLAVTFEAQKEKIERLRDQLNLVSDAWSEGYSSLDLTEALEAEVEELKTQNDMNLELAQIGMAINTINHEFEKTVGSLRNGFKRFNKWAEFNPDIQPLYDDMRISFDHLDGYLSLFTPFDKRLIQKPVEITGKDISDFLIDLFQIRFERHNIKIESTAAFLKASITGYPSSFYPAFVNLIDNAIYWLDTITNRGRKIRLDFQEGDFLIEDNGPGVLKRDESNIFNLNFTRKPGGRGMGLYISRETLQKVGYQLKYHAKQPDIGARFSIAPRQPEE